MAFKEYREIKVCKQSGYHYKPTPTIILKGQWLQELGFTYGDKVQVRCEKRKLIIAKAEEAVVAFSETSTTSVMKVAEAENRYGSREPLWKEVPLMGKVYMCGSFKGGVGKTVTTFNLAYSFVAMGKKVLAVDFDSQANLSTCFGVENTAEVPVSIGDLMMAAMEEEALPDPSEYIQTRKGVDFIPSSMLLSAVDSKLRLEMGAEGMLRRILEPLKDRYDVILLDTCPSLGALNINAMAAADEVIITVNPQLLAMMGLQDFLRTVRKIRSRINEKLQVAGILLTMCDVRTNLCRAITEEVADTFRGQIRIFDSVIPTTVKVGESVYYGEPLLEYAPETKACAAYQNLAKELMTYEGE